MCNLSKFEGNTIPVLVWELFSCFWIDPDTDGQDNCDSYSILFSMVWIGKVNNKSQSDIWSMWLTCVVTLYADLEAPSEQQTTI